MELWLAIQNESTKRYVKIWINTWKEKCCYLCTECHRWLQPKPVPALLHSHDRDYANASFKTEESHYSSSRLYFLKEKITFIKSEWQNSNLIHRMFHSVPLFLIQGLQMQWVWYSKMYVMFTFNVTFQIRKQIASFYFRNLLAAILTSDVNMRCHSSLRKSVFVWLLTKISSFKTAFWITGMALRR
jgi:hypothetical protein